MKIGIEELKKEYGACLQIDSRIYFYSLTDAKKFMDVLKTLKMTKNCWPAQENILTAYMYYITIEK